MNPKHPDVTPAMIEAGVRAALHYENAEATDDNRAWFLSDVYSEMNKARWMVNKELPTQAAMSYAKQYAQAQNAELIATLKKVQSELPLGLFAEVDRVLRKT